jgi:hypothetical protein
MVLASYMSAESDTAAALQKYSTNIRPRVESTENRVKKHHDEATVRFV